jgi:hypothetical protein
MICLLISHMDVDGVSQATADVLSSRPSLSGPHTLVVVRARRQWCDCGSDLNNMFAFVIPHAMSDMATPCMRLIRAHTFHACAHMHLQTYTSTD